jgi:phosphoesterase RecJ-like protein
VTHKNPDGDALGSTLALAAVLQKLMHTVNVVLPNDFPRSSIFFLALTMSSSAK